MISLYLSKQAIEVFFSGENKIQYQKKTHKSYMTITKRSWDEPDLASGGVVAAAVAAFESFGKKLLHGCSTQPPHVCSAHFNKYNKIVDRAVECRSKF